MLGKQEPNQALIQSRGTTTSRGEGRKTWQSWHDAGNLEWETDGLLFALSAKAIERTDIGQTVSTAKVHVWARSPAVSFSPRFVLKRPASFQNTVANSPVKKVTFCCSKSCSKQLNDVIIKPAWLAAVGNFIGCCWKTHCTKSGIFEPVYF